MNYIPLLNFLCLAQEVKLEAVLMIQPCNNWRTDVGAGLGITWFELTIYCVCLWQKGGAINILSDIESTTLGRGMHTSDTWQVPKLHVCLYTAISGSQAWLLSLQMKS